MSVDDEDEWEYEYEEDQTEALYITLDISTHTPPGPVVSKKTGVSSSIPQNQRNDLDKIVNQIDGAPTAAGEIDKVAINGVGTLQILDLHTHNPIIKYDSQVYTCYWATDIGTSLYLAPPNSDSVGVEASAPSRSFPSFDLLAKTRARLVAIPAQLKAKPALLADANTNQDAAPHAAMPTVDVDETTMEESAEPNGKEHFETDTADGDHLRYGPGGRVQITVPANATEAKTSQARFLEKWSELRAQKGKTDYVPVKTMRQYKLPEGWQTERAEWLEKAKKEREQEAAERAAKGESSLGVVKLRRRRQKRTLRTGIKRGPGRPRKIRIDESEDEGGVEDDVGAAADDDEDEDGMEVD